MSALLRRIAYYFRRRRFEAELSEELGHHQDLEVQALEAEGLTRERARAEARRRLGRTAAHAEASREHWQLPRLEMLARDLRFAVRGFVRQPGFTAAVVVTLALGIGASTAAFSVVNAVLFRPLSYPGSDRLIMVWEHNIPRDRGRNIVSTANYRDWKARARTADLAIFTWASTTFMDGQPERFAGRAISLNMLDVLGVRPALGRAFQPEDYAPGQPTPMILGHDLWAGRFGADSSIVGRPVRVRDGSAIVVGVMPEGFRPLGPGGALGSDESYWEPFLIPEDIVGRGGRYTMVVGRLREGATLEGARAELTSIAAALAAEYPASNTGWTVDVVSLKDDAVGSARPVLLLLMAAIGLVLVIACANVANLMLGRAVARRHETGLRTALGASRRQLLRQWTVEGAVLAGLGGVLGVAIAVLATRLLVGTGLELVPRLAEIRVDRVALAVALGLTALVALVAGLAPVAALGDADLRRNIGVGTGRDAGGASALRAGLVVTQVAFSLVLLAGGGLLVRSLARLNSIDPGFVTNGVLTLNLNVADQGYRDDEVRMAFFESAAERAATMPGVASVGMVSDLPLTVIATATSFRALDRPEPADGEWPVADIRMADPGYFPTLEIGLLEGRLFDRTDRVGARPVALVNASLARTLWPRGGAIGQRLRVNLGNPEAHPEIVGVVDDVRQATLAVPPRPMIYYPARQQIPDRMYLVVRASDPTRLRPSMRSAILALDADLPLADPVLLTERLADDLAPRRYTMMLMGLLSAVAVVLAAVGLYGVLTYLVRQRTREMALRRALGATGRGVMVLVLRRAGVLVGAGLAIGIAGALAGTRLLQGLLFDISPSDPAALLAAVLLLVVVGLAASVGPVRRVGRVDPVTALRSDD